MTVNHSPTSLHTSRFFLSMQAAYIEVLNEHKGPVTTQDGKGKVVASGFFYRNAAGQRFLCTCWHVVSGCRDFQNPKTPLRDRPRYLNVTAQAYNPGDGIFSSIGGEQRITLPLYAEDSSSWEPLWWQNTESKDVFLGIGLTCPECFDLVMLPLPDSIVLAEAQIFDEGELAHWMLTPMKEVAVLGFPYGYMPDVTSPTPIALTRRVAASRVEGRPFTALLDGMGAPGMSGGPVVSIDDDGRVWLVGIYTGCLFPEAGVEPDRHAALGTFDWLGILSSISFSPCKQQQ